MTDIRSDLPPLPHRMKNLPLDHRGYPIPWFVAFIDGKPDFRVIREGGINEAHRRNLCWICGQPRGQGGAFVIGPMCAINRVSSEPPSHTACAKWAAKACPFLTRPMAKRNEREPMPSEASVAGIAITRNPGVTLVWITSRYTPFMVENGKLFDIGEPVALQWYAQGRAATREEVTESIRTGFPDLLRLAQSEGDEAVLDLVERVKKAAPLIPKA